MQLRVIAFIRFFCYAHGKAGQASYIYKVKVVVEMEYLMRAAVLYQKHVLRVEDTPIPKIERDEVLVEVRACGICATDLHIYEGEYPARLPIILGHEFSGRVVDKGSDVRDFEVGDDVVVDPNIYCGRCYYCRVGRPQFCFNKQAIGVTRDGAYAEYVRVPSSNLYRMPPGMSYEEGAFVEPTACIVHGIRRLRIRPGEVVVVFGLGPIGLIFVQLVRSSGASQVIGVDILEYRLAKARELGADVTINAKEENVVEAIKSLTGGLGADVAIEATGNPNVLSQVIQVVGNSGRILVFGVAPKDSEVSLKPFDIYRKEITITGSYTNPHSMDLAIKLIRSGAVKVKPLITHRISIEDVPRIFRTIQERREDLIKVMITPR